MQTMSYSPLDVSTKLRTILSRGFFDNISRVSVSLIPASPIKYSHVAQTRFSCNFYFLSSRLHLGSGITKRLRYSVPEPLCCQRNRKKLGYGGGRHKAPGETSDKPDVRWSSVRRKSSQPAGMHDIGHIVWFRANPNAEDRIPKMIKLDPFSADTPALKCVIRRLILR